MHLNNARGDYNHTPFCCVYKQCVARLACSGSDVGALHKGENIVCYTTLYEYDNLLLSKVFN